VRGKERAQKRGGGKETRDLGSEQAREAGPQKKQRKAQNGTGKKKKKTETQCHEWEMDKGATPAKGRKKKKETHQ